IPGRSRPWRSRSSRAPRCRSPSPCSRSSWRSRSNGLARRRNLSTGARTLAFPSVDTHTHLDICTGVRLPLGADAPETEVRGEEVPGLDFFLDAAHAAVVQRIVEIGGDVPAARATTELVASQYAGDSGAAEVTAASAGPAPPAAGRAWMLGGVALHPNEAPRL